MDCQDFQTILSSQEEPSDEAEQHLDTCEECLAFVEQELVDAAMWESSEEAPPGAATDLEQLYTGLASDLAKEEQGLGFLKSLPRWQRLTLVLFSVLGLTWLVAYLVPRHNLSELPLSSLLLGLFVLLIPLALGSTLFLRPLHKTPLPPQQKGLILGSAALMPVLVALFPETHAHPAHAPVMSSHFWSQVFVCTCFGVVTSLPLITVLWLVSYRNRPRQRSLLSLGLVGGLMANVAQLLHCPAIHPAHLLVGHAFGPALIVGCGLLLLWWMLELRQRLSNKADKSPS